MTCLANGQPVTDFRVTTGPHGRVYGSFTTPSRAAYNLGDFISLDGTGIPTMVGIVQSIRHSSIRTEVEWAVPEPKMRDMWQGMTAMDIIDTFARDFARKHPA